MLTAPGDGPGWSGPQWGPRRPRQPHRLRCQLRRLAAPSTTVSMINSETCNGYRPRCLPEHRAADRGRRGLPRRHRRRPGHPYGLCDDYRSAERLDRVQCGHMQRRCPIGLHLVGLPGRRQCGPNAGQVDPANDTLYTANYDNTISAFDLSHCNASDLAGCSTAPVGPSRCSPDLERERVVRCRGRGAAQRLRHLPARRRADGRTPTSATGAHGRVQTFVPRAAPLALSLKGSSSTRRRRRSTRPTRPTTTSR